MVEWGRRAHQMTPREVSGADTPGIGPLRVLAQMSVLDARLQPNLDPVLAHL